MSKKVFALLLAILLPSYSFAAMKFVAASSQYVGLQGTINPSVFTITAWVYQTTQASYRTVYASDTNGFWMKDGVIDWYEGGDHLGTATIPANTWTFVAITYTPGSLKFYVNGVLDKTAIFSISAFPNGLTVGIGGHNAHDPYDGYIDDVRIYAHVLTDNEMLTLADTRSRIVMSNKSANDPLGWWKLDEGRVNTVATSSSTHNSGFAINENGDPRNGCTWAPSILHYP